MPFARVCLCASAYQSGYMQMQLACSRVQVAALTCLILAVAVSVASSCLLYLALVARMMSAAMLQSVEYCKV